MVQSSRGHAFVARGFVSLAMTTTLLLVPFLVVCDCLVPQPPQGRRRFLHVTPASREELYPPLILLGGIAQTKSSWDHHLASLARNRRVLVYECLGQGDHRIPSHADDVDVSLPAQAKQLLETLRETLVETNDDDDDDERKADNPVVVVDMAGFSFGGRVAMATACLQTDGNGNASGVRIRRLHLTGVGCDRSDFGHLAMRSFPEVIRSDPSLRSFAWSILLATYSPAYLRNLPEATLERVLQHIAASNDPHGLLAILAQAEVGDAQDPWHVTSMAGRLANQSQSSSNSNSNPNTTTIGRLCVGALDKMAPVHEVERLQQHSDWIQEPVDVLSDCGHAVVLEQPRAWRESVLSFLDDER